MSYFYNIIILSFLLKYVKQYVLSLFTFHSMQHIIAPKAPAHQILVNTCKFFWVGILCIKLFLFQQPDNLGPVRPPHNIPQGHGRPILRELPFHTVLLSADSGSYDPDDN